MTQPDCTQVREALDELLDGDLPREVAATMERHVAGCADCAAEQAASTALRAALRQMPVPAPRPGFAAAALAAAIQQAPPPPAKRAFPTPPRGRGFAPWRRLETWAGATIGAAAAAALIAVFLGAPGPIERPTEPPGVRLTLFEAREIGLAIDTETALPGATLTILLEGGIDLVGFAERREVRWQADLDAGTNMLSLPIMAHSLEAGRLTALVEHGDKTQRIAVDVRVDAPATDQ
ncbi:MAG: anti-sigma factor family protein [Gammaproteobacteria bacterium]